MRYWRADAVRAFAAVFQRREPIDRRHAPQLRELRRLQLGRPPQRRSGLLPRYRGKIESGADTVERIGVGGESSDHMDRWSAVGKPQSNRREADMVAETRFTG